jgi:anti-sigma regulatory factor (Ser/Thr protein kinase)
MLERPIVRSVITALRGEVRALAAECGLVGQRLEDFLVAINEVAVNAVMHGGGSGRLALWHANGELVCEITDSGPGIPPDRVHGAALPSPLAVGGRGLWLARRLSDSMSISGGAVGGTVVRLAAACP